MKKTIMSFMAVMALITTSANATAWDVENPDGSWSPNPDCTGACRDDGIPDSEREPPAPTPEAPTDPKEPVRESEGRADHVTPDQHWTGTCEYNAETRTVRVHTAFGHNQAIAHRQCFDRLKAQGKF